METKIFPTKAFYKVITEDNNVKEIHYITADEQGNLYLERHDEKGDVIYKTKLRPEE